MTPRTRPGLMTCVIVRAYAPVGGHEELLPYLVRRLLENGANSSFVHALLDERVPASAVAADPISLVEAQPDRHPKIPVPKDMYGDRQNSLGRDYSQAADREAHAKALELVDHRPREVDQPVRSSAVSCAPGSTLQPRDQSLSTGHRCWAMCRKPRPADIDAAVQAWPPRLRSNGTARAAPSAPSSCAPWPTRWRPIWIGWSPCLAREAGKTLNDGVAEVREAAGLLPLLRPAGRARLHRPGDAEGPDRRDQPAVPARTGRLRLHLAVELPPGHLHRPDRRRPGRRQRRPGQARRTDPADRLRGREACITSCRPEPRACWRWSRVAARRWARPWSPMRASTASPSPAAPTRPPGGSTRSHRRPRPAPDHALHRRDWRPERHVHRHYGAQREQVIDDVIVSGLRLGRPAVLGPAPAVPARRHRRAHHRRPEGRDGRAGRRRSGPGRHRRRPGHRRRGPGRAGDAPHPPWSGSQGAARPGRAGWRDLLRACPGRNPGRRLPGARGVRPDPARGPLQARKPGAGRWRPGGAPLWPDPGHPFADRALRGRRPSAWSRPATPMSIAR